MVSTSSPGGALAIDATGTVSVEADSRIDMAGRGHGGGGIPLSARQTLELPVGRVVRTRGGFSDGVGTATNGGTIKLIFRALVGTPPAEVDGGRVLEQERDPP